MKYNSIDVRIQSSLDKKVVKHYCREPHVLKSGLSVVYVANIL